MPTVKAGPGALFPDLQPSQQRGSKPRCHLLTCGNRIDVAAKLTALVKPHATVSPNDFWLPIGFGDIREAQLGETRGFLTRADREEVTRWWLKAPRGANTPNWDLVSTCTVGKRDGLILVEAKAHEAELHEEGKPCPTPRKGEAEPSENSLANHAHIAEAIREANTALNGIHPGFNLSAGSHYQLANRFAWAWKVASHGIPVILVYLGFLDACEMADNGKTLLSGEDNWIDVVLTHSNGIVPEDTWSGQPLDVNGTPLRALIRAAQIPLSS